MKRIFLARKRSLAAAAVIILILGGIGAAYYVDINLPYWHFRTVEKDKFYRTSQLDGEQFREAIDDYGIKTIVNLRDVAERTVRDKQGRDWYAEEQAAAKAKGIRLLDVPLRAGHPPSPEQIQTLLSVMDDEKNLPVLIHCYHGSIRSAALEGLWRREYMGEDGQRALRRVESWGRDLQADYPLIYEFIRDYVPRRKRGSKK